MGVILLVGLLVAIGAALGRRSRCTWNWKQADQHQWFALFSLLIVVWAAIFGPFVTPEYRPDITETAAVCLCSFVLTKALCRKKDIQRSAYATNRAAAAMKETRSFYDPQSAYRSVKRTEGLFYCVFAVFVLACGYIFDRRLISGAFYIFIYGLGYYFGRRNGLSETVPIIGHDEPGQAADREGRTVRS